MGRQVGKVGVVRRSRGSDGRKSRGEISRRRIGLKGAVRRWVIEEGEVGEVRGGGLWKEKGSDRKEWVRTYRRGRLKQLN